jgi:hypothetical protein
LSRAVSPYHNYSNPTENAKYLSELWLKFTIDKLDPLKNIFVFTEGVTDEVFYRKFIEKYYAKYNIKFWVCGTRDNVEEILLKVKDSSREWSNPDPKYHRNRLLFLLDRDFNLADVKKDNFKNNKLRLNPLSDTFENIFITDLHSIENYLVGTHTFKMLLIEVFKIIDTKFLENLGEEFEIQYNQFINFYLYCICWLTEIFPTNTPFNMKDRNIYKFILMNKEMEVFIAPKLISGNKPDFQEMSKILKNCISDQNMPWFNKLDSIQLEKYRKNIEAKYESLSKLDTGVKKRYIRGKDDLWFFVWYYNILFNTFKNYSEEGQNQVDPNLTNMFKKNFRLIKNASIELNEKNAFYILTYKLKISDSLRIFLDLNSKNWKAFNKPIITAKGNSNE